VKICGYAWLFSAIPQPLQNFPRRGLFAIHEDARAEYFGGKGDDQRQ